MTTSVDWEKTGTRTSVSAVKRKLKMQSVGKSTTTTLNVNTNVKLWCSFATKFFGMASFKTMQDLICTTCNKHSTLGLPVRSAGLFLFFLFFARVRLLAVKLQGNFKTSPSLPQAERLCSSSAKTLCALMIPLTTTTDCYYGFCYSSTFTSFKLFKIAFSIIITS